MLIIADFAPDLILTVFFIMAYDEQPILTFLRKDLP